MLLLEIHDEHDTKVVDQLDMDERINERSKVRSQRYTPNPSTAIVDLLLCGSAFFSCALIPRHLFCLMAMTMTSQAHIHEIPPKWMTHYGFDEITDEEYQAAFKSHSLGDLMNASREGS